MIIVSAINLIILRGIIIIRFIDMLFGWIFHSVKVSQENEKRLDRLKELGNQMEYSYEKINGFDKELKKVSTSITQLLSDLGEVSKKMENKLK
jgi:hypothetical protein